MNFYWSHDIALQKLSNGRSYKFSRILTLTEVISIRILRIFSAIVKFYWSHTIPLHGRFRWDINCEHAQITVSIFMKLNMADCKGAGCEVVQFFYLSIDVRNHLFYQPMGIRYFHKLS